MRQWLRRPIASTVDAHWRMWESPTTAIVVALAVSPRTQILDVVDSALIVHGPKARSSGSASGAGTTTCGLRAQVDSAEPSWG